MSYDRKKLVEHLKTVFEYATTEELDSTNFRRQIRLGGPGDKLTFVPQGKSPLQFYIPDGAPPGVTIYDAGCDALDSFISEYSRDIELSLRVGPNAVQTKITDLVSELATVDGKSLDYDELVKYRILKPLRDEIRSWRVVIPLVNINVERSITIGNVQLLPHTDGFLQNIDLMNGHDFGTDIEKAKSDKFILLKVVSDIGQSCSAWASVIVDAHSSRIATVAADEVDGALNVARSFVHAYYTRQLKCTFGMLHEISGTNGVFIADANKEHINVSFENRNALARFELTEAHMQNLQNNWCFEVLSSICAIRPSERTNLQSAVHVANHWLSRSAAMMTSEEALAACTIAIERLLVRDGESTTVDKFAERLAYLLSTQPDERQSINKLAKQLYDIRSRILHAGFRGIRESDLIQMEWFAMLAVAKVAELTQTLRSHDDLISWFNNRKFS